MKQAETRVHWQVKAYISQATRQLFDIWFDQSVQFLVQKLTRVWVYARKDNRQGLVFAPLTALHWAGGVDER